jgi:predicted nucleic-acid-binding protein
VLEWHDQDGNLVVRRAGRFNSSDLHLVQAEMLWVLDSVYDLSREQISTAVEMLLQNKQLTLQDADVARWALDQYQGRPVAGFSDCLVLEIARKAGHLPVGTLDRDFARLPDVQRAR